MADDRVNVTMDPEERKRLLRATVIEQRKRGFSVKMTHVARECLRRGLELLEEEQHDD